MKKVLLFLILISVVASCYEETPAEYGSIDLLLTANSAPYNEVNITIDAIQLTHLSPGEDKTQVNISTYKPEQYNLLKYSNGKSTLLASTKIAPGTLTGITIYLTANTLVTTEGIFDLNPAYQQNTEVLIQVNEDLIYENNKTIYLNFDVKNSVRGNNGTYYFEPVINAFSSESTGSINGIVNPAISNPSIIVEGNKQTFEANIEPDGYFCVLGLTEGVYNVSVLPTPPFIEKSFNDILVKVNEKSELGTILLEKKIISFVEGDLNINPATSEEERFEMQTPTGIIDMDVIYAAGDAFTYSGLASEIKIMPKAEGRTLNFDGTDIALNTNSRYTITSIDSEMQVELRNTSNGNGHWWIKIVGNNITIVPDPTASK